MTTTQSIPTDIAAKIAEVLERRSIAAHRTSDYYLIGTVEDFYRWAQFTDAEFAWAVGLADQRGEVDLAEAMREIRLLVA